MGRRPTPLEEMYDVLIDGCWHWRAAINGSGYPTITRQGRTWLAHRWMWTIAVGPIPERTDIRHCCTNRLCVNPEHLIARSAP